MSSGVHFAIDLTALVINVGMFLRICLMVWRVW